MQCSCHKWRIKNQIWRIKNQIKHLSIERLYQDPLEKYFRRNLSLEAGKVDPTLRCFKYNDNLIRNQKVF